MAVISEIAPNIFRISTFAPSANLQFNHFLVKDDEPLLYHTGLRGFHAEIHEAVSKLINVSELRHIGYSHFESDECGSLNEWLTAAPDADVICSQVGAFVNVNDFIGRESRALPDGGTLRPGSTVFAIARLRICPTAGTLVCFSKKRRKRCSVRTCSIMLATSNRSPLPMSLAARISR
jgi:flavorubredoxin